jgi:hypothetical protein
MVNISNIVYSPANWVVANGGKIQISWTAAVQCITPGASLKQVDWALRFRSDDGIFVPPILFGTESAADFTGSFSKEWTPAGPLPVGGVRPNISVTAVCEYEEEEDEEETAEVEACSGITPAKRHKVRFQESTGALMPGGFIYPCASCSADHCSLNSHLLTH